MLKYHNIDEAVKAEKRKIIFLFVILCILLAAGILSAVCSGAMDISVSEILKVMANKLFGANYDIPKNVTAVVWNIRLPRIICSVFVGAGLAVSGVIFQGILQNPLADPYTLGISTGASFGAALAIVINMLLGIYLPVSLFALLFALITLAAVIKIAYAGSGFESSNLIIAGIIVSSVLSSGISFIKMLSGEGVGAIVFWIMGSFSAVGFEDAAMVVPAVTVCAIVAAVFSNRLDIMALGDRQAEVIGVNTAFVRLLMLITGSLITAFCVCICGVIGFVGLIVPHLLRYAITAKNRVLVPMSALSGSVLLLYADSLSRVLSGGEIPVGVITTLIGGPFFIFIFIRKRGR